MVKVNIDEMKVEQTGDIGFPVRGHLLGHTSIKGLNKQAYAPYTGIGRKRQGLIELSYSANMN